MRKMAVCLLVLCLLPSLCAATGGLGLETPQALRPFEQAQMAVDAPVAGRLTLRLWGPSGYELPLTEDQPVQAGRLALTYAGTSYGGMPLKAGAYRLIAILDGADGLEYSAAVRVEVGRPASALQYALPKSGVLYARRESPWFLDCAVSGKCEVCFQVYEDEAMTRLAASVRKTLANSGQFRIAWNGQRDGRRLTAGTYFCRVFKKGDEENAFTFPLLLSDEREPVPDPEPLGPLLPEAWDDASVWRSMLSPIVVVDIEAEKHQALYAKPSPKSEVMGRVHGQSQGVEVLSFQGKYALVRAWRHEDGQPVEGYVPTKKLKVVTPNPRYGVLVDKKSQTLTVYENGAPIGQCAVSTGLPTAEKPFRETRTGAFITTDRPVAFESNGFRCDYPIRIDGGNLLHQVGYDPDTADFSVQQAQLGRRASEGCVRVDWKGGPGGINAYWLWTHLPFGTKVLVRGD